VELDAISKDRIKELLDDAVDDIFDDGLYEDLQLNEEAELTEFRTALRNDFDSLLD